jgi:hypothetical protein
VQSLSKIAHTLASFSYNRRWDGTFSRAQFNAARLIGPGQNFDEKVKAFLPVFPPRIAGATPIGWSAFGGLTMLARRRIWKASLGAGSTGQVGESLFEVWIRGVCRPFSTAARSHAAFDRVTGHDAPCEGI